MRGGCRLSALRAYVYPKIDQANLTVLTDATVSRAILGGRRAATIEFLHEGAEKRITADGEIVLSMGAIATPKVLMQSAIGDADHLRQFGIGVVQHLPGVGRNLQDHILLAGFLLEYALPLAARNNAAQATLFCKSDPTLDPPDLQSFPIELPFMSEATAAREPPAAAPDRRQAVRSARHRRQSHERSCRHDGGDRARRPVPGNRQFGSDAHLCQARGDARRAA